MNKVLHGIERRTLKRWQLFLYLRVFEQGTGALMGHIVDISEKGMKLISDDPIPVDRDFELWIDVPRENMPRQRIALKAHSLWNSRDINPDFYDTGFRLINLPTHELVKIREVIDTFKTEFKIDE